jgi:hypothetical protein
MATVVVVPLDETKLTISSTAITMPNPAPSFFPFDMSLSVIVCYLYQLVPEGREPVLARGPPYVIEYFIRRIAVPRRGQRVTDSRFAEVLLLPGSVRRCHVHHPKRQGEHGFFEPNRTPCQEIFLIRSSRDGFALTDGGGAC